MLRARFTVYSEISFLQMYKDIVNVSLFYSHSSSDPAVVLVIKRFPSYAGNCFVDAINCRFSDCPLLNDGHFYIFEFRSNAIKFASLSI